jgi:hypothetical protein
MHIRSFGFLFSMIRYHPISAMCWRHGWAAELTVLWMRCGYWGQDSDGARGNREPFNLLGNKPAVPSWKLQVANMLLPWGQGSWVVQRGAPERRHLIRPLIHISEGYPLSYACANLDLCRGVRRPSTGVVRSLTSLVTKTSRFVGVHVLTASLTCLSLPRRHPYCHVTS